MLYMQVRACFKLSFFTYIISHSIHIVNKQLKYILYIQYYFLCKLPPESFLCFSAEDSFAFWNTKSFTPSADLWYDKSKRRFHLVHWMAEDSRARFLNLIEKRCADYFPRRTFKSLLYTYYWINSLSITLKFALWI